MGAGCTCGRPIAPLAWSNGLGVCYRRTDYQADGVHPAAGAPEQISPMLHWRLRMEWPVYPSHRLFVVFDLSIRALHQRSFARTATTVATDRQLLSAFGASFRPTPADQAVGKQTVGCPRQC